MHRRCHWVYWTSWSKGLIGSKRIVWKSWRNWNPGCFWRNRSIWTDWRKGIPGSTRRPWTIGTDRQSRSTRKRWTFWSSRAKWRHWRSWPDRFVHCFSRALADFICLNCFDDKTIDRCFSITVLFVQNFMLLFCITR